MPAFTRILVPTDFGPTSDAALAYAKELARRFDATLTLLHVAEREVAYGPDGSVVDAPALQARARRDAERLLRLALLPEECEAFTATFAVVDGSPVSQIVAYARDHGVDLIVMGTHGRTGLVHVLLGSVAERTVRTAPCPVLTVRSEEITESIPDTAREFAAPAVALLGEPS